MIEPAPMKISAKVPMNSTIAGRTISAIVASGKGIIIRLLLNGAPLYMGVSGCSQYRVSRRSRTRRVPLVNVNK